MPRIARVVAAGVPHHITQRGNNRQQIFFSDRDRRFCLTLLRHHAERHGLRVLGWCLMPNHVHLIAIPEHERSLARALGRAHYEYAIYLNHERERSGHLWQNRFFSTPLDRHHLRVALRYVDLNPVRAGLAEEPAAYLWSSALPHVESIDPPFSARATRIELRPASQRAPTAPDRLTKDPKPAGNPIASQLPAPEPHSHTKPKTSPPGLSPIFASRPNQRQTIGKPGENGLTVPRAEKSISFTAFPILYLTYLQQHTIPTPPLPRHLQGIL